MHNQYALVRYRDVTLTSKLEILTAATQGLTNFASGIERILQEITRTSEVIKSLVTDIAVLANDYEQLLLTRATEGVRVNITEATYSLTSLINDRTTVTSKVDQTTIAKYTRKLVSRYHPDRRNGDANVLDTVLKASKAGMIEILYLYLVTVDPNQFDIDAYGKMIGKVNQRRSLLQTSKAYDIARTWMVGRKKEATVLMIKALDTRKLCYVRLLSGEAFESYNSLEETEDYE